jgi:aminopeptidase YwaD
MRLTNLHNIRTQVATFILLCVFCIPIFGQKTNSRVLIETLSSANMHGRGYVNKGDSIAAHYLKDQFKKRGLLPIGTSYYQNFTTPVNTFPGNMYLSINGKQMTPAVDFLIAPTSPSVHGEFKVIKIVSNQLLDPQNLIQTLLKSKEEVIVIDCYELSKHSKKERKLIQDVLNFLKYGDQKFGQAIVFCSSDKLTWGGATSQAVNPFFTLKKKIDINSIENITVNIESHFIQDYKTQNVIGYIPGVSKDSVLVLTAHYDHLGRMGKDTYFPGANDNASGVALVLQLASYFSKPENKPKYDIVCIAFAAEEIGLLGSQYFVKNPLFPLGKIKFLLNFDLAGTGDEGIKVVNATVFKKEFDLLASINKKHHLLKEVKTRGESCNSDHCWFYKNGVPSFFIYTLGGTKAYHDIYDTAAQLPLSKFENFYKLLCKYIDQL